MGSIEIDRLSPRTIIVISKLVYENHGIGVFDLDDLNKAIRKLGIYTDFNLDVSFVYEVIQLNQEKFYDNTISTENLILPQLKNIEVLYYKTYSQVVTYNYREDIQSYSKKKAIVDNFFRYEGDDYVDIDSSSEYDKEYGDSDYMEGGIIDIN
jgi:hypothetical protein